MKRSLNKNNTCPRKKTQYIPSIIITFMENKSSPEKQQGNNKYEAVTKNITINGCQNCNCFNNKTRHMIMVILLLRPLPCSLIENAKLSSYLCNNTMMGNNKVNKSMIWKKKTAATASTTTTTQPVHRQITKPKFRLLCPKTCSLAQFPLFRNVQTFSNLLWYDALMVRTRRGINHAF